MKRLIATAAVTASFATSIFAVASGAPLVAKEGELRNGADDTHIQLVGREGELRNGADDTHIELVGREGELRNGADNGADDKVVARGDDQIEPVQPQPESVG